MSDWYSSNLVLIQGTFINLLLALSLQVPFRFGVFSFAGVGAYGVGGYAAAILVLERETPALVAILGALVLGALVSWVLALVVARLGGLYLGMATIAFTLIVGVVAINGGELTGGVTGLFGVITDFGTVLILAIALVTVVLVALTERGVLGRRIEAVREDPELAGAMGVNVRRYRTAAFVASGALGAVAGAMNALVRTTIGPDSIGFTLVVLALTMMIIGGTRSWVGAFIGALIFTWLPTLLETIGEWQHLAYGLLVALAAIYMPGGLVGVVTDARRSVLRKRRSGQKLDAELAHEREDDDAEVHEALAELTALAEPTSSHGGSGGPGRSGGEQS